MYKCPWLQAQQLLSFHLRKWTLILAVTHVTNFIVAADTLQKKPDLKKQNKTKGWFNYMCINTQEFGKNKDNLLSFQS